MTRTFCILLAALAACDDTTNPGEVNEGEVITTVALSFTPVGGGDAMLFSWADPENDGDPVIDPITLSDAADYTLEVSFLNELSSPTEDLTAEVAAESDQHQVFVTGVAVEGPATGANPDAVVTQAYEDLDANGFPVGLEHTIATVAVGSGPFVVTLRHLPPEGGEPVKSGSLAQDVAEGGLEALPGDTDASVSFDLRVE